MWILTETPRPAVYLGDSMGREHHAESAKRVDYRICKFFVSFLFFVFKFPSLFYA